MIAVTGLLRLISLFLALAACIVVVSVALLGGQEPLWAVLKGIGAFAASWMGLKFLVGMLAYVFGESEMVQPAIVAPAVESQGSEESQGG